MAAGIRAGVIRTVIGVAVTTAGVLALLLALGGAGGSRGGGAEPGAGSAAAGGAPSGRGAAGSVRVRPAPHANPLAGAATRYAAQRSGTVLAAVYDVRTGQTWRLGAGSAQAEASVVKLNILQALLANRPGGVTPAEGALAAKMIEDSDNDAATSLWEAAGGPAGLAAYNRRAGLTRTTPSSCVQCAGFPWPGWGLSTTDPADQLTLLKHLIKPSRLLTPANRRYALSLMEHVTPDQRWGVSGGVPAGVTVALKNGWLPLDSAQHDWQVNSVGWVHGAGRDYLIAVFTTGNPAEQYGIDTINRLSTLVWSALG